MELQQVLSCEGQPQVKTVKRKLKPSEYSETRKRALEEIK